MRREEEDVEESAGTVEEGWDGGLCSAMVAVSLHLYRNSSGEKVEQQGRRTELQQHLTSELKTRWDWTSHCNFGTFWIFFFSLKVALLKLLFKMLLCLSRLSLLQQFPRRENSVLLPKCILLSLSFSCLSRCFCWEKKSNNNMKRAPPWTDKV